MTSKAGFPLLAALVLALTACGTVSPSASVSPSATPSVTSPTASPASTVKVMLYYGNTVMDPGATDCSGVWAVQRTVQSTADAATVALEQLFAGPTSDEKANGYTSFFSQATMGTLKSVKKVGSTAYVNLTDVRQIIPNASTSCGSASYLAQMNKTVKQAAGVSRVLYAINGDPEVFWEWLQMGCDSSNDNCDKKPFSTP